MRTHSPTGPALFLIFTLALPAALFAGLINVPDDYRTVQAAINAAQAGDTVLVEPGRYVENIVFNKYITVASLYLTESDEDYIESTVLDGNRSGEVVSFELRNEGTALLTGFTITNGFSPTGGGIHCNSHNPTVSHCRIVDNEAEQYGGGLYIRSLVAIRDCLIARNRAGLTGGGLFYSGEATLSRVVIADNESGSLGGGIYLTHSDARIEYCVITGNRSGSGGGIYCTAECEPLLFYTVVANNSAFTGGGLFLHRYSVPTLENATIAGNDADSLGGGIFCVWSSGATIHNSIVWDNYPAQIYFHPDYNANSVSIYYTDLQDGQESIELNENGNVNWGDGNLNTDPLFAAPSDDDFHLRPQSPCIDVGDPNNQLDLDRTPADLGAFPLLHRGALRGYVYDSLTGLPLPGAVVYTTYGYADTTGDDGYWMISDALNDPTFDLIAGKPGFLDSTLMQLQLRPLDTLDASFTLFHPVFSPSTNFIYVEVAPGQSAQRQLAVENPGNWRLQWELIRGVPGVEARPWDLMDSRNVSAIVGDTRLRGVAFVNDRFYVTGDEFDTNYVYVLDRDMNPLTRFPQFGGGRRGMGDLTWDGELLWGSGEWRVFGFTTEGDLLHSWRGPTRYNEALAWDPDRQWLWIAATEGAEATEITAVDTAGRRQRTLDQNGLKIYGLEYWADDPDGYNLYAFHSPDGNAQMLTKFNLENGDNMFVRELQPPGGGSPQGVFITSDYNQFTSTLIAVSDVHNDDRVDVWFLLADPFWLSASPMNGVLRPGESQQFELGLSAADLDSGIYRAELRFILPEVHNRVIIPAELWVGYSGISDFAVRNSQFALGDAYPNPFNSSFAVSYKLSAVSPVSLILYDVAGREISNQQLGISNPGSHRAVISGEELASGVYILKLAAGNQIAARKIVCVK